MIIGIGSDLCNIERIEKSLQRFGDRFLERVFTDVVVPTQPVEPLKDVVVDLPPGLVGNPTGGPPPRTDLDNTLETGTAPWDQILIAYPPPPPRPPEPIPF